MTILVTGARGQVGSAVLSELVEAGATVRASSRDPKPADFPDGVEVVRADLSVPESFPDLLAGVSKVFLYANPDSVVEFTEAARSAGVEQIVLLSSASVVSEGAESNPIAIPHANAERALERSGLGWTFVRPSYFATNTLRWHSIRTNRSLVTAFPEGSTPLVHENDIAAVAALALLESKHLGKKYLVLGAGSLTIRKQVATIAEALGEPVRLEQVDVATYRSELEKNLPAAIAEMLIQAKGTVEEVPAELRIDSVPVVLGRPALTFAEWAHDHADDFR